MGNTNSSSRTFAALLILGAGFFSSVLAQTVREDVTLFDKPDGNQLAIKLKGGTLVKMLKRQGFWVEIDAGGKQGWLKVSTINFSSGTAGPTTIETGRLGTGNIVATSAARGLSAKDLLQGKPNYEEVTKLEKISFELASLQTFRAQGGVQPISLNVVLTSAKPKSGGELGKSASPEVQKKKGEGDDW